MRLHLREVLYLALRQVAVHANFLRRQLLLRHRRNGCELGCTLSRLVIHVNLLHAWLVLQVSMLLQVCVVHILDHVAFVYRCLDGVARTLLALCKSSAALLRGLRGYSCRVADSRCADVTSHLRARGRWCIDSCASLRAILARILPHVLDALLSSGLQRLVVCHVRLVIHCILIHLIQLLRMQTSLIVLVRLKAVDFLLGDPLTVMRHSNVAPTRVHLLQVLGGHTCRQAVVLVLVSINYLVRSTTLLQREQIPLL